MMNFLLPLLLIAHLAAGFAIPSPEDFFLTDDYTENLFLNQGLSSDSIASTDETRLSACASQGDLSGEQQSLVARRDGASCTPPLLPSSSSSDALRLFQDPLDLLLEKISPVRAGGGGSFQINTENYFPSNNDEQGWSDYTGVVTFSNDKHPCEAYVSLGYVFNLCCNGPVDQNFDSVFLAEWYFVGGCDYNPGTVLYMSFLGGLLF